MQTSSIAKRIASILSAVFSPLLVPSYGIGFLLLATVMTYFPASVRWTVFIVVFVTTCILPLLAILGLWRMKYITDPGLNNRNERSIPYIITGICYLAAGVYMIMASAPIWLWSLLIGGAIADVICLIVNRWWKISAHMAAMGGLVAMTFAVVIQGVATVDMLWWVITVILLAGLVGTSRVLLRRHTLLQVLAGCLTGFLCVILFNLF